jgi:hypothetical protein
MADKKKPMPKKPKPRSLREKMKARSRMIDEASGFAPVKQRTPPKKKKKDGTTAFLNRRQQENLI